MKEYADIFEGTGKLQGKYHLELDNTANPAVHPPRKAIKEKLKSELERLTKLEIIKPVSNANSVGFKFELSRAKVFSVVDAKNGFLHVELVEESSLLTTFNIPFGHYRWLRIAFGLSSAPEEYQRRQDQTVEGLPGVRSIVDDILIYGEGDTEEEAIDDHDRKFRALMERCRERNFKLNKEKLKLKLKESRFIGPLVTSEGLKPDPEKIRAVMDMPKPTVVSGVRRIIGFVTYLSKFLQKLIDICEPLRKLTLKDSEFC
ncbi:Hypothetical predicted protein [Mytilus galloprovincialis]|uniref:Reverse transcriptase domain-containing protein n=1 Tax=Mytilus galloprovincialis TaxID=29158 RepID=A0A8B6BRD6_MYTGA|nr:Hypothetical predicted protein [Mytilus galloprovincialis]